MCEKKRERKRKRVKGRERKGERDKECESFLKLKIPKIECTSHCHTRRTILL